MKFDRSSVNASSSRLRLMNCSLTVVSSSFADCSSSFVVSSSSFVLWSSSLLDSTSSCAARSSWLGRFLLVDDGLEVLLGSPRVPAAARPRHGCRSPRGFILRERARGPRGPILRLEHHEQAALGVMADFHGQDTEREFDIVAAVHDVQPLPDSGAICRRGLGQRAPQLHEQARLGHAEDVGGRLPARRLEVQGTCARETAGSRTRGSRARSAAHSG